MEATLGRPRPQRLLDRQQLLGGDEAQHQVRQCDRHGRRDAELGDGLDARGRVGQEGADGGERRQE